MYGMFKKMEEEAGKDLCIASHSEKVLIVISTLIHTKSMYIMYEIYLSYIPQTESNY